MIFDGVATKAPPMGPKMQGFVSVVSLLATTMMAAEQSRKERVAKQRQAPSELEEVMAQSGLNIPGMHDVLVTLMGGSEEAKQAATMIASCPDPSKLLQKFVQTFAFGQAANTGPIVTPPPTAQGPAAIGGLPTFRPDFTREAREAAKASGEPAAPALPTFRADFTREAREAAKSSSPPAQAVPARATGEQAPPAGDAPLIRALERRLGMMRQKAKEDMASLEARIGKAEAVLAALRVELQELLARKATKTAPIAPVETAATAPDAAAVAPVSASSESGPAATPVAEAAGSSAAAIVETTESTPVVEPSESTATGSADVETSPSLPAPMSEAEGHRAATLVDEFAEEVEAQHQAAMRRIAAVEDEATALRALIQQERESEAGAHG